MQDNTLNLPIEWIADAVQANLVGAEVMVQGVSTDTRYIDPGDLFVALRGPNFDGHEFVADAVQKGACAVLVERQMLTPVPQLIVKDCRLALGRLASAWRSQFDIPVIAITGSNGKTTVKEMLAAICSQRGATLWTRGNFNNDIGVPLTLLRLHAEHRYAVIELGANHPGEIAYLTQLVKPDVALVNNAGPAHLEGFGSIEGVAYAKGEIYSGLSDRGVAIINADDKYSAVWDKLCRDYKILRFGNHQPSDVTATWHAGDSGNTVHLRTPLGSIDVQLGVLGEHNIMNAMAATTAAVAAGCDLSDIQWGLQAMQSVKGRLQIKRGRRGSRIIDDTYNANPASVRAAIDVLKTFPGERLFALGDMGELGDDTQQMHAEIGEYAKSHGVHRLFALGKHARSAAQRFGSSAMSFEQHIQLIDAVDVTLSNDVTLLVKGSRAMQMEIIVNALVYTGED